MWIKFNSSYLGLCEDKIECVAENYLLISQPKHMLWVLKRTVSYRTVNIERPKHVLKLIDKQIIAILR